MNRLDRLPLRVRLVAGFLVAMIVLLSAAGAFVYWRVEFALDRGLDEELDRATETIGPLVGRSGRITSPEAADATGTQWQVLDSSGEVLASRGPTTVASSVTATDLKRSDSGPLTRDIGSLLSRSDLPYRVRVTRLNPSDSPSRYLVVGVRRDNRDEALRELLAQLALAGLGALVVAALVGDVLARTALRPVERYRQRAADIAKGATGLRLEVPPGRDDEVTRLGHTLNEMLGALDEALDAERRFVNDASHELRTPLTLLKSRIQLARRRPRSSEEHEIVLDELSQDVARLVDLAEQLLDLGSPSGSQLVAHLPGVVSHVIERRRLATPDGLHLITLEAQAEMGSVAVHPRTLERIVTNLVDNAFRHGRVPVLVRVARAGPAGEAENWSVVQVTDDGPGMSRELLHEATRRFTRAPEARARPGAGLGLALVSDAVGTAGGELRLCYDGAHARHAGSVPVECDHPLGMTVSVFLPIARPS